MTKKYQQNHTNEHKRQTHCAICNRYKKYNELYPDITCNKCAVLITDKQGKQISFHPVAEAGQGIQGIYTESGKLYRSTDCYIKGVKCKAEETNLDEIIITPTGLNLSKRKA